MRRAGACGRSVSVAADPARISRRGRRADGAGQGTRRQGPAEARGRAAGDAGNTDRGQPARGAPAEFADVCGAAGRAARRGVARCLDRVVRDRGAGRGRVGRAVGTFGAGGDLGAERAGSRRLDVSSGTGDGAAGAAGRAQTARRGVLGREPGCVRHVQRRGGGGGVQRARLRPPHPGREPAADVPSGAGGDRARDDAGRGDARQPRDRPRAGWRDGAHAAGVSRSHALGVGRAAIGRLARGPAARPGGDRGAPGWLDLAARQSCAAGPSARGIARHAGLGPRAGTARRRTRHAPRPGRRAGRIGGRGRDWRSARGISARCRCLARGSEIAGKADGGAGRSVAGAARRWRRDPLGLRWRTGCRTPATGR